METWRPRQWGKPRSGFEEPALGSSSKPFKLSSITLIKSRTWSPLEREEITHISLTGLSWWSRNSALVKTSLHYKVPRRQLFKNRFKAVSERVVITITIQVHGSIWFALTTSARSIWQGPCPQKLEVHLRQILQACPNLLSWIHEKANKIWC